MALMIREYVDASFVQDASGETKTVEVTEAEKHSTSVDTIDPDSLMVEIEGIHAAPFATRNFTRYTPKCLKESIASWTKPYNRPLIKHHNESNGDIIGRIIDAKYVDHGTLSGTPAIRFTVNVPDEQAKKDVKNGLLATTSIGATAHDVRCSICGEYITNSQEGCPNGHERGRVYDDNGKKEVCYWDVHEMEGKELSFVVVPSDMYSQKVDVYPATANSSKQSMQTQESYIPSKGAKEMAEAVKPTELDEAKAKIEELSAKVTELTEAKETSEKTIAELTEAKKALEAENTELKESKEKLETSEKESAELKESMEKEIADSKAALKESMAETYMILREALGADKADVEEIKKRSMDSLKDSICDMKESLASKTVTGIDTKESKEEKADKKIEAGSVKDPSIAEDVEVAESAKSEEPIDLRADLRRIFSDVVSARRA